jgi:hypothetical protein
VPTKISDEEFAAAWNRNGGSPTQVAVDLNVTERRVYDRRNALRKKGIILETAQREWRQTFPNVLDLRVIDGVVLVFSDAHWWPGLRTPAYEALLRVIEALKPVAIIANGDLVDGASTNRHDPHGWAERPSVKEEIETVDANLHEIVLAAPKGCRRIWNIGNHDLNFERRLATRVPEYAGMAMVRLEDHFPTGKCSGAPTSMKAPS